MSAYNTSIVPCTRQQARSKGPHLATGVTDSQRDAPGLQSHHRQLLMQRRGLGARCILQRAALCFPL